MKTFALISYFLGIMLLTISCFTTGIATTWWLGGCSVAFLAICCILQYQVSKHNESLRQLI